MFDIIISYSFKIDYTINKFSPIYTENYMKL